MSGLDVIYEQMGWPATMRVARTFDCPSCGAITARPCTRPARRSGHDELGRAGMGHQMHASRFAIAAPCERHGAAGGRPCPRRDWAPEYSQVCEDRLTATAEVAGQHARKALNV